MRAPHEIIKNACWRGCASLFCFFINHRFKPPFSKILLLALVFFIILGHQGPIFYGSVFEPFRKSHANYIRKMYKRAISRPFSLFFFKPLFCNILLLALVFLLFFERIKSTFFIIFGLKIMSGASVAVGPPLQVLCFLYFGEPFLARWIFSHFSFFFHVFHVFA